MDTIQPSALKWVPPVADLLMTSVLRILRTTDLVRTPPALEAYRLRGEERPAFRKALAAQMAPFATKAPKN